MMTHGPQKRIRGRPFEKGNPGRPQGSKNRRTQVLAGLSDEDQQLLLRRAFEIAMQGEPQLLKFLLSKTMPKDRLVQIHQPVLGIDNEAADVIGATLQAVCGGEITPDEGARITLIAREHSHALETADIIKRLDVIEAKLPNARSRK